jgi:hypothetical protein
MFLSTMKKSNRGILILTLVAIGTHSTEDGHARDSPQAQLESLRKAGKYGEALSLLDELQNNKETPPKIRITIDFERGVTLMEASKKGADLATRRKQLDQAQESLDRFINQHATHVLATCAKTQRTVLFAERARQCVEESKLDGVTAEKLRKLVNDASKYYGVASEMLASASSDYESRLARFGPLDPQNPSHQWLIDIRERYRAELQMLRQLAPVISKEKAAIDGSDALE